MFTVQLRDDIFMNLTDWSQFFATNWGLALAVSSAVTTITLLASKALADTHKESLSLWLMGAAEGSWSQTFCRLFDAIFGENHFHRTCIARSVLASLIAVIGLWVLMGSSGALDERINSSKGFWDIIVIGLFVNVLADYVSLLETRYILGQMHRVNSIFGQFLVLLIDAVISGLIIVGFLRLYGFINGEAFSFAELLGAFSIFAVFFYSTFVTSVWTWLYILSTWVMRLFTRLKLNKLLAVTERPYFVLGLVMAPIAMAATLGVTAIIQQDQAGISRGDRLLCELLPGKVCLNVAGLTDDEKIKLNYIIRACETGLAEECMGRGMSRYQINPAEAVRLFTASCLGNEIRGCYNLSFLYENGAGVAENMGEAEQLFKQACDGNNMRGCSNLGFLYDTGVGVTENKGEAARLYKQACDGNLMTGCTNLGLLYETGAGVAENKGEAARLYKQACDGNFMMGCSNLGFLYKNGAGVAENKGEAARLFKQACDGGLTAAC